MKGDLIERYVYAVTKRLPRKQREDVSMELNSLIDDMLTERCGDETPTEKDIRAVLTELGSPYELYAKYDEDAERCLIGQPYFSTYKLVLKIVLAAVAVGVSIGYLMLTLVQPMAWYEAVAELIGNLFTGLLSGFAIVTLLFAFFHHKGVNLNESFKLDDLPEVPKKTQEVSRTDAVIGIVIDIVFIAIFLAAPQLLGLIRMENGEIVPIFNVEMIRASWYIVVLFGLFGIIRESVKLLEGRYSKKVMYSTIAMNLLSAGTAAWWLSDAKMFNPDFSVQVIAQLENTQSIVMTIFENFRVFFLCVMILALAIDTLVTVVRTIKK